MENADTDDDTDNNGTDDDDTDVDDDRFNELSLNLATTVSNFKGGVTEINSNLKAVVVVNLEGT